MRSARWVVTAAAALALALALAGCSESGALVTVTLPPTEAPGIEVFDGELFVASASTLERNTTAEDSFVGVSRSALERGYVLHLQPPSGADGGPYIVALALWQHEAATTTTAPARVWWGHIDQVRIGDDALRSFALELKLSATTQRRPGCPTTVEPVAGDDGPVGALWLGGWLTDDRCIGWDGLEIGGTVEDPDCDGEVPSADAACLAQGAQQCWSDVPDAPAEDFDGDGFVADTRVAAGVQLMGQTCVACDSACECQPGNPDFNSMQSNGEQCGEGFSCAGPDPLDYIPERRCVNHADPGGCSGGSYRCADGCAPPNYAVATFGCEGSPPSSAEMFHCGKSNCDYGDNEPGKLAAIRCPRLEENDVGCWWYGSLELFGAAGVLANVFDETVVCRDVTLWGGADELVEAVEVQDSGPRTIQFGDEVPCRAIGVAQRAGFDPGIDGAVILTASVGVDNKPIAVPVAWDHIETPTNGCADAPQLVACTVQ